MVAQEAWRLVHSKASGQAHELGKVDRHAINNCVNFVENNRERSSHA